MTDYNRAELINEVSRLRAERDALMAVVKEIAVAGETGWPAHLCREVLAKLGEK